MPSICKTFIISSKRLYCSLCIVYNKVVVFLCNGDERRKAGSVPVCLSVCLSACLLIYPLLSIVDTDQGVVL